MSQPATLFDRVSRYLAGKQPEPMLAWLCEMDPAELKFVRWINAHLGSADSPERIADRIAHVLNLPAGGFPWAWLLEFQTVPDAEMFGRVLEYLGAVWKAEKPTEHPGDRFAIAALVVNLTGTGTSFPGQSWPTAGFTSSFPGRDIDLCKRDARTSMTAVERGEAPIWILPWIPLMKNGAETDIIERWKARVDAIPDRATRGEMSQVLIFAELAECREPWEAATKEETMRESAIFNRQMDAALAEIIPQRIAELLPQRVAELLPQRLEAEVAKVLPQRVDAEVAKVLPQKLEAEVAKVLPQRVDTEVAKVLPQRVDAEVAKVLPEALATEMHNIHSKLVQQRLQTRFGSLPDDLRNAIDGVTGHERFADLIVLATNAPTLADFRRDAGL